LGGGMYGIGIGSFFAGESMFHTVTNGSKVALMGAATTLANAGISLFDVQWCTPHLESLGAVSISQTKYLELLESAVDRPTKLAGLRL
jgi:leucyl/phenylalanyl-tRNA--protein transferase